MEGEDIDESNSVRPRYSLLTLVLFTTIVALSVGLWQVNRKYSRIVEPLRHEVRQLRNETGQLQIDDPGRIYIRNVKTLLERHTWEWRIHLPADQNFLLKVANKGIPKYGFPTRQLWSGEQYRTGSATSGVSFPSGEVLSLPSGEFVLRVGLRKDSNGHWHVMRRLFVDDQNGGRLSVDGGQTQLFEDQFKWLEPAPGFSGGGELWSAQKMRDPDQPVELLRLIPRKGGESPPSPSEGVMLWIEEDVYPKVGE